MSKPIVSLIVAVSLLGCCHTEMVCSFNDVLQSLSLTNLPGPDVRPVKDWRNPTVVYIDFYLYTVIDLDTSLQILTTLLWFNMVWTDEFISWNPGNFCEINRVRILGEILWKPDLYVYEMTDYNKDSSMKLYYSITSNGLISYSAPLRIVTSCNLHIFKFPFDTQTCTLTFGPYIHSVEEIIMLPKTNSSQISQNAKEIFVSKGDWTLQNITVENQILLSDGVNYSQVIYQITIKRAPIVYIINLIIPSCFLVFLDIASMFIPIASGERLSFKITVVLGFSVVLLILNDMIPNSDDIPFLGIFCCVCMAIMVFSTIISTATLYMYTLAETEQEVPLWVKTWIIKYLACALCFHCKSKDEDLVVEVTDYKNVDFTKRTETNIELRDRNKSSLKDVQSTLEVKLLKRLLVEVLKIHQQLVVHLCKDEAKSEWYIAVLIVERLILIVYFIIIVALFVIMISVWSN
ncbi:5-hydroxytryptamine receptor 3A-like [Pelobates cultripes]|uniref:5-hydroxytryptamine receptor 3A-like n=1 Tax=Pelobates cultripes TaxID=61616 RepID=A0AAD1WSG2_PELCU|nr:5-hydroxytryptamine receptor 3A-like [Pelobates cultripes]